MGLFLYFIINFIFYGFCDATFTSGFWYKDTRPPQTQYESLPYANLTVKINRPFQDGPGEDLITDPLNSSQPLYTGNTINRWTFDTQFILDLAYAIDLDVNRVFVGGVVPGDVHFTWEASNVIVNFVILERNDSSSPTLLDAVALLTNQIQNPDALLYRGTNVTNNLDPLWGLHVINWDVSLKLSYAIEVVGGENVVDGYYLNQGGLGICNLEGAEEFAEYCEFERFFEDDIALALNISSFRVQILFIKSASMDSVTIFFRIIPAIPDSGEKTIEVAIANLTLQVPNPYSDLYKGNVTIRVDPTWGVSGNLEPSVRQQAPLFTLKYYEYESVRLSNPKTMTLVTDYNRCQANRRCNWGIIDLNQTTNDARFYQRLFENGDLVPVNLFLDFEDWRMGTRGFSDSGQRPPMMPGNNSISGARAKDAVIAGAHFSPFTQRSLGPDLPCYLQERNQGLVLDRRLHRTQMDWQESLVQDLDQRINWTTTNIEWATMGPSQRSRKDNRESLEYVIQDAVDWWENEVQELKELNVSQCVLAKCTITFNTSSLTLTGAINDIGQIRETEHGTEVAVFTFNSIYLGPETEVLLVGQRALALVSKTTAIINTTILAEPGTIGGFQGGYSIGRLESEALSDTPRSILICELNDYCTSNTTYFTEAERDTIISNNVNGPGSGNLRIHSLVVTTQATDIVEVQQIEAYTQPGQTLAGGFSISFGDYTTPIMAFNIEAEAMATIMQDNLNILSPGAGVDILRSGNNRAGVAGIGLVTVSRIAHNYSDYQDGYTWLVTFTTAIGNIQQLVPHNYLQGLNADITVTTVTEGNHISGTFQLQFQGNYTVPILAYETAAEFERKLRLLPMVSTAFVERIDPTENCDDGLCTNGPLRAKGVRWTIYVTTDLYEDNVTPRSPTSPLISQQGDFYTFIPDVTELTGINATVLVEQGMSTSDNSMLSLLNITTPFSLAFGGAGASHGGLGGAGYSTNPVADVYNDRKIKDLLGGSGGCLRSIHPFEINAVRGAVTGRGGHGGGAIEVTASNDIVIGSYGELIMNGGDGEQSSEGGGGGGSGGSILLTAGGVVVVEGKLDVTGGDGGYGGTKVSLAGGGGGGGRVAFFGQSITVLGDVLTTGGPCGVYNSNIEQPVIFVQATIKVRMITPVNAFRLLYLAEVFVTNSIDVIYANSTAVSEDNDGDWYSAIIDMDITLTNGTNLTATQQLLNLYKETNLAEVILTSADLLAGELYGTITPITPTLPNECSNVGGEGTTYSETAMTTSMYVRDTGGAEGTNRAIFLSNAESTKTNSGSEREAPFAWNGPIIPFVPSQPGRVTYYTRMDAVAGESKKNNFGTLFTLLSRGVPGLNVSSVIGVFFGDKIMQGHNFGSAVDEHFFLKRLATIGEYPAFNRWYKVDIHINWIAHTYYILLDDVMVVQDIKFTGDDVDGIRLSSYRATNVWFDEIYVGFDNTMNFVCPTTTRKGTNTIAPVQRAWSEEELAGENGAGYTTYQKMARHYNHMENLGTFQFDGQGKVEFNSDVKFRYPSGDYPLTQGKLHAGALMYLSGSTSSWKTPSGVSATVVSEEGLWFSAKDGPGGAGDGRQFYFTEYNFESSFSSSLSGGVAACSSQDLLVWRFEGIVFHYTNLSDLVYGTEGPFNVERPKVLFNEANQEFVMWAVMDNSNRSLAMSAIATSKFIDGPFLFRRSFYPDGNRTRDQVVFINGRGTPVLGRTYYQTLEFVLPDRMMQPIWESAKYRNGSVAFPNNYHRAFYHSGYDNFHDIFDQRWRKEDVVYNVTCVDKTTGAVREVAAGVYTDAGTVCVDPEEFKEVIGQGDPAIPSQFLSPNDSQNSWWMQTSVPAVKAQQWGSSYQDGYCGVRLLNDGMDISDPALADFEPNDRSTCSNIADNPVHETVQDKLIGVQKVVSSRRAKFMALSELTDDFMDTNGNLNSFEGELSSGNLISMIAEMGQFGFEPGHKISSTYSFPRLSQYKTAIDYQTRFRQYIRNRNDRASYSLACIIDGTCPVNFAEQITTGQT